jgi:hypothetical protein
MQFAKFRKEMALATLTGCMLFVGGRAARRQRRAQPRVNPRLLRMAIPFTSPLRTLWPGK